MSDDDLDTGLLKAVAEEASALASKVKGSMRRLSVEAGAYRVEIEWQEVAIGVSPVVPSGAPMAVGASMTGDGAVAPMEEEGGHAITSPLVGTFYRSPEPGADAFVTEGGPIEAGQDVAIVEAMKIMNRIQSDVTGTVRKILVNDGEIVEFGQKLIIVDVG